MTKARLMAEMSSRELAEWIAAYRIWQQPQPKKTTATPPQALSPQDEVALFKREFS